MTMDEHQKQEAQELYTKLIHLHKEKAELEALKKDREEQLKTDIASACDIKNKQGEPIGSKVKMPIVVSIIDEIYHKKPNKKDEEADTLDIYRNAIKKEEVNKELLEGYVSASDLLTENKENIKEAFKETSLLSKEMLDAIALIVKEEYKTIKEDSFSKAGFESKPQKDKSEVFELKAQFESILKGKNDV